MTLTLRQGVGIKILDLKSDYDSLFLENISGEQRKDILNRFYLHIALVKCGPQTHKIADFTGYSEKTIKIRLQKDAILRRLFDEYKMADYLSNRKLRKDVDELLDREMDIKKVNQRLAEMHIKRTSSKLWFKNLPYDEQDEIIRRIKKLYR